MTGGQVLRDGALPASGSWQPPSTATVAADRPGRPQDDPMAPSGSSRPTEPAS